MSSKIGVIDACSEKKYVPNRIPTTCETFFNKVDHIYDVNPPYQRGSVWQVSHRRKLIQSIICHRSINAIHLVRKDNGVKVNQYWVLDGRQRIDTLRMFIKDLFAIKLLLDNGKQRFLTYSGIKKRSEADNPDVHCLHFVRKLNEYALDFHIYEPMSLEEQKELFASINFSKNLTSNERRYCEFYITRNFYSYVWNVALKPIHNYVNKNRANNYAYSGTRLSHNLCYLSFGTNLENSNMCFQTFNTSAMNRVAKNSEDFFIRVKGWSAMTEINEEEIDNAGFKEKIDIVRKAAEMLKVIFTENKCLEKEKGKEDIWVFDCILFLIKKIQEGVVTLAYVKENTYKFYEMIKDYANWKMQNAGIKQTNTDEAQIKKRIDELDLLFNDNKYSFDVGKKNKDVSLLDRRRAIVNANKRCPISGKELDATNVHIDHVIPKSKSSTTPYVAIHCDANTAKSNLSEEQLISMNKYVKNNK